MNDTSPNMSSAPTNGSAPTEETAEKQRQVAYHPDSVLFTDEVALWLGCSVRSLQRLPIKRVALTAQLVRYLASDVYAYLRGRAA